ncbi:helix-loop-helix protein delilah-like [Aethina tumida]|uniref:helix-loop-helix protein delilah-like n=1 Tax=Aethina tumida TaxID=116153 RepID=UPI002147683A|nr:helix-loop-helix protein delilah-like [Aethina tumida]
MMDSLLHFGLSERLQDYTDANNNTPSSNSPDKYSLRPRSLRRITETKLSETGEKLPKNEKQKQKAAPLSKYRRKTANARERNRMREINQAFEALRRVIPQMQTQQIPGANEKLTKITTLRLAMKYISSLSATLNGCEIEPDYGDLDCFLLESDGESLPLSDHSLLASPDFPETSLSPVDFGDPSLPALLHTDFTEHVLEPPDFGDFLLT